ncbi:hypothetical protein ACHAWF_010546 [Thalassiosira exigua]
MEHRGSISWSKEEVGLTLSKVTSYILLVNGTMSWTTKCIKGMHNPFAAAFFLYLDWMLRGVGQIFFCNNCITGLLVLLAIALQTEFSSCIACWPCSCNSDSVREASWIRGTAVASFHSIEEHVGYSIQIIMVVIFLSVLSTIAFAAMSRVLLAYDTPPMTLPFDFLVCIVLLASTTMANVDFGTIVPVSLPEYEVTSGSLLGSLLAIAAGINAEEVHLGLYGYCPALTFIATEMFFVPSVLYIRSPFLDCQFLHAYHTRLCKLGSHILAIIGVLGTTILQAAITAQMGIFGLPVNSLPFSIMLISIVLIQGDTQLVISVPLESITTPEDHIRRVRVLKKGFAMFLDVIHENIDRKKSLLRRKSIRPSRNSSETHIFSREDFESYLSEIGFTDAAGLAVAKEVLLLFDFDRNGSFELDEFKAFCEGSVELGKVHELLKNFFDFVDNNGDGAIQFEELDQALDYLGEPGLTEEERKIIARVSKSPDEFQIEDMVIFVSAETMKKVLRDFLNSGSATMPSMTRHMSIATGDDEDTP